MKRFPFLLVFCLLSLSSYSSARSEGSWSPDQLQILGSIDRLSATTAPDGTGADAYGKALAEDFSRWTTGSTVINRKKEWVEGIRSWFDDGWRVADRNQVVLEITIRGDHAFTRRIVEETYLGPDGEKSMSKAALAETWARAGDTWLLFRVSADVLDSQ